MKKNYTHNLISVCVPTYQRPDTLEQLINSFLKQSYSNKELVISDDSKDDSVEKLVSSFRNKSLRYFKNKTSIGFSDNYLKALTHANGEFLITMGDDDVFISDDTLQKYANVFKKSSSVYFVYSNQVQFSQKLEIEYIISMFRKNRYYKSGEEAITNLLVNAVFIGGIGLRNKIPLKNYYAQKKILHPQVELVGNVLSKYDAYSLSDYLIGVRSDNEQIIYRALKDKHIRKDGDHMNVELFEIFDRLNQEYNYEFDNSFLGKRLIPNNVILLFKEKMILGNEFVRQNYKEFCKISSEARKSIKLKIAFIGAIMLPGPFIYILRMIMINIMRLRYNNQFSSFRKKLLHMIKA